jgi:hypothetical protein
MSCAKIFCCIFGILTVRTAAQHVSPPAGAPVPVAEAGTSRRIVIAASTVLDGKGRCSQRFLMFTAPFRQQMAVLSKLE